MRKRKARLLIIIVLLMRFSGRDHLCNVLLILGWLTECDNPVDSTTGPSTGAGRSTVLEVPNAVKTVPQSIWPVSVFGLGFLLIIMGLSGVASIQETRRIHQQILAVENTYRNIENVVESIRSDTSRVAVLRRDRLLERDASASAYTSQLGTLRAKTELSLAQLKSLRPQHSSGPVERLETALEAYLKTVEVEFQQPRGQTKAHVPGRWLRFGDHADFCDHRGAGEAERREFRIAPPGIEPVRGASAERHLGDAC